MWCSKDQTHLYESFQTPRISITIFNSKIRLVNILKHNLLTGLPHCTLIIQGENAQTPHLKSNSWVFEENKSQYSSARFHYVG